MAALIPAIASAKAYPNKPIKIITPFSAGSGPDAVLRIVSDKLAKQLGQSVVIDNRPGGNGFIALDAGKRAPADGYTLVQMDDAHTSLLPHLYKNAPYEAVKDFDPVNTLFRTNFFVVVPTASPWKNMSDLIASAKAKPDALTYGSWFIGSPGHLGAAVLESATGSKMLHIPFKQTPDVYQAVATGEVSWAFGTIGSAGPLARAGKVRFLAVAAPKREATLPDVPTIAESGGPNMEVKAWVMLQAPKGTPPAILARLNEAIGVVLADPEVREKFQGFGFHAFSSNPQDITKSIQADKKRYADIVRASKIAAE